MDKYEIHIGETYDKLTKERRAKYKFIITTEQLDILKRFAHHRKDADLDTIYTINDCEFRAYPHYDIIDTMNKMMKNNGI